LTALSRLVLRSSSMSGDRAKDRAPEPYHRWTLWLNSVELSAIDAACEALHGIGRSQLVHDAAVEEAHRLGFSWTANSEPSALEEPWPYLPDRSKHSTSKRICVSVALAVAELVARAAQHIGTSEPQFLVGATMAYIGRLQARWVYATAEGRPVPVKGALQKIRLPSMYRSPK